MKIACGDSIPHRIAFERDWIFVEVWDHRIPYGIGSSQKSYLSSITFRRDIYIHVFIYVFILYSPFI